MSAFFYFVYVLDYVALHVRFFAGVMNSICRQPHVYYTYQLLHNKLIQTPPRCWRHVTSPNQDFYAAGRGRAGVAWYLAQYQEICKVTTNSILG